jgi:hypothetical protein
MRQGRNTPVISGDTFHVRRFWPFCFNQMLTIDDCILDGVVLLINSMIRMITIVVNINSIVINVVAAVFPSDCQRDASYSQTCPTSPSSLEIL